MTVESDRVEERGFAVDHLHVLRWCDGSQQTRESGFVREQRAVTAELPGIVADDISVAVWGESREEGFGAFKSGTVRHDDI